MKCDVCIRRELFAHVLEARRWASEPRRHRLEGDGGRSRGTHREWTHTGADRDLSEDRRRRIVQLRPHSSLVSVSVSASITRRFGQVRPYRGDLDLAQRALRAASAMHAETSSGDDLSARWSMHVFIVGAKRFRRAEVLLQPKTQTVRSSLSASSNAFCYAGSVLLDKFSRTPCHLVPAVFTSTAMAPHTSAARKCCPIEHSSVLRVGGNPRKPRVPH